MAVSDRVKSGPEKAPHRSLWKALGLTDEELKLPLIGVVSAKSECVPGHNHLNNIAQAVKDGIRLAGGVPVEFPAIGVCDGIAMGHVGMKYSLASRELIADSCESMAIAHGFDGMVFIPNCDKIVPGMLMAARRLNLPAMVVSGGPMMPGRMPGGSGDMDLNSVFEAVGAYKAGKMDDAQLNAVESAACPGCGSCSGMFTANSMNCITEVIGMALPGNGTIAAVDAARIRLAKKTGMRVVELVREGLTPEKIMTESAFRNALCLDMALGCSTNTVLHLPAIAHEAGIDFDLNWVNEASAKVPNLCHLAPAGHHHVIDLHLAGGVMGVLSELKGRGLLDENALTVSGMTLGEEISLSKNYNHEVIRPFDEPYSPSPRRCSFTKALPACSTARTRPSPPSTPVRSSRATWWSSAMKARRAARACAKCSARPAPSAAWGLTRKWRSSPTAASPAQPAARPSATFRPRARAAA